GLLTEDVEFDPIPASFALPAESGPYPLSIHGSPKGTGTLKIIGYITHCLGVRSHCRLRDVPTICESFYEVDVVAALPQLLVHTSLPQSAAIKATPASSGAMLASATVNLFAGQSHECEITLHNCGQVPVQSVIIHLDSSKSKDISDSVMFSWSKENIETQLPIQPGNNLTFTLYIKAMADFITSDAVLDEDSPYSPYLLPEFKSMSLKSNNSDVKSIQSLEALQGILCIKYSGGEGHVEGYYRVALVGIQIIIQPSIQFTKWTTMPAPK
uniref:Trafficking protein particle complex subunit 9-like n=1 Tax=Saccoglossus kowalevskii TaxID=10224 RepID=A0ABM0MCX0_SACKO